MRGPMMDAFVQRLERLERENRRLKRAGVVVLAAITALGLMGQATPSRVTKVIAAEHFILRDSQGRNRGGLLMVDGRPTLHLADDTGRARAELIVLSNNTPALRFYDYGVGGDTDPKFLAWMGVSRYGSTTLALTGREDQSQAQMSAPNRGAPRLSFIDRAGRVLWSAP